MKAVKLHELLAVSGKLRSQADKTRGELMATFEKKRHLFTEKTVTFKPLEENALSVREEQLDLNTTVPKELKWVSEFIVKALDVAHQVEVGNTTAKADVVLEDGTVILKDVPATSLLQMEKRLNEIREFVGAIPTLDPAKGFSPDPDRGEGVYKAREEVKTRTKKSTEVITKAPATDKHPAQVELVAVDKPTGSIVTQEWSGLITTASKGDMLERVEDVTQAVKRARSRANDLEVSPDLHKIGSKIVRYIFGV